MINLFKNVEFDPIRFEFIENGSGCKWSLAEKTPIENYNIVSANRIKNLSLLITNNCNLRCPYCYEFDKKKCVMDKSVVKQVAKVFGSNIKMIQFFGGEPLLETELIKFTHDFYKNISPNIQFGIITNGILLDKDFATWLSKSNIKGLTFSWDGFGDLIRYGQKKELSEQVLNNLLYIRYNTSIIPAVRFTVNDTSLADLLNSIDYLIELGISFYIEPAFDYKLMDISEKSHETLLAFYDVIGDRLSYLNDYKIINRIIASGKHKYYGCSAGRHSLRVDCNGDIYDCHRMMPKKENYLGNVFSITNSEEVGTDRFYKYKCNVISYCCDCEYKYLCGGGCVYSHSKRYCDVIKAKIKSALKKIYIDSKNDSQVHQFLR